MNFFSSTVNEYPRAGADIPDGIEEDFDDGQPWCNVVDDIPKN